MATNKPKKETKQTKKEVKKTNSVTKQVKKETKKTASKSKLEKKRLIISFERLPEKDKDAFELQYENGFMDYLQSVMRPDGTPLYVVPLETEENIYMVKVDVRVDAKMSDEDFDKEVLHSDKTEVDTIDSIVNSEGNKVSQDFKLNHGDYSSMETMEEVAKEDMTLDNFSSLDEIDVEYNESNLDL